VKPALLQTKPLLFCVAALGIAAFCMLAAPRAASAYEGLMPGGGQAGSDGYDGLLAPSQPAPRGSGRGTQEPPGYEGLIRGTVPQRPAEGTADNPVSPSRPAAGMATTPAAAPLRGAAPAAAQTARPDLPMTPRPGRVKVGKIGSAEQLMMLAALNGRRLDLNKIAEGVQPSPALLGLKDPKQHRIRGMLPMELMAKTQIDKVMASVSHPQLTPEQRQTNARNGYAQLMALADGVMSRRAVPEALYRKMGMSDTFLAEEQEASERALARFQEAFKVLKPLQ
jgi:hypothetical protein